MDKLKVSSPGFDYRIKKDTNGLPTGIMYMTAQMRTHARRYGSVLCLDAQKRQYNSSGWPYIAPVVKDNEMKVAVAAESIVTEETHEYYIWILQCMVEIEPRFQLCNVRLIFADQKITPTVLNELGIESTCTLRGDFYPLLHEVWPNHFHSSVYPQIQKFLRAMLLSSKQIEWDSAYLCASEILCNKPRMLITLNDIYGDPEKYAGFHLRGIEGNLMLNGDVSAEQNHSGVVAYLGEGACYAVAEQITHLLSRQKNLDKIRRQREDDQYVHGLRFQSSYFGPQQQADDAISKKSFSGYGFISLWTPTIRRSWNLQSERLEDGSHLLWPTKVTREERTEETTTIISEGCRCSCPRRVAMLIQCEHEYVVDGGIDIFKFGSQWLHRQTYDRMFPDMASVFPPNVWGGDITVPPVEGEDYPDDDIGVSQEDLDGMQHIDNPLEENDNLENLNSNDVTNITEKTTPLMPCTSEKVTYQHIQERSSELARTCQNDQPKMRTILSNITQMIERVRDGHDIFINFAPVCVGPLTDSVNINTNVPRSAISKAIVNATGVKRKQSGREFHSRTRKKHRKGVAYSQVSNSNDDMCLPPPNSKTRSCRVCRQDGHGQGNCPLITKFGVTPLESKNMVVRYRLSRNLSNVSKYQIEPRPVNDPRSVLTDFPGKKSKIVKALVIHRRFLINQFLVNPLTPENICLECTILHEHGIEHPGYTCVLFDVDCVSAFITKNQTNLILCQLEDSTSFDNNPSQTTMPPPFSQAPSLSQASFPTQQTQESLSQINVLNDLVD
jgi:hypothetical protein